MLQKYNTNYALLSKKAYFGMEWNMEEKFLFGMEWKEIASMEYEKIVFHTMSWISRLILLQSSFKFLCLQLFNKIF